MLAEENYALLIELYFSHEERIGPFVTPPQARKVVPSGRREPLK